LLTQRELETVLDEELNGLADRYRAPLLLCYLEGQTQDEAAALLGWSKASLRRRLERGRDLLRARLLRRGVTLSLGLLTAALAARADAALVPLVRRAALVAVRAAGGAADGVPAGAAALADWGMRTMATTRKFLVAWLVVSVLAAGGVVAHALTQARP